MESASFINPSFGTSFQVLRIATVAIWCKQSQLSGSLQRAHHKWSPQRAPQQELRKAVTKLSHLLTALKIRKAVHANLETNWDASL